MKNKQQKPQPIDRHTYLSNSIHKTKVFQMALDNLIDDLLQADYRTILLLGHLRYSRICKQYLPLKYL